MWCTDLTLNSDLCFGFYSLLGCCMWNPITTCFQIPHYLMDLHQATMVYVLFMWVSLLLPDLDLLLCIVPYLCLYRAISRSLFLHGSLFSENVWWGQKSCSIDALEVIHFFKLVSYGHIQTTLVVQLPSRKLD